MLKMTAEVKTLMFNSLTVKSVSEITDYLRGVLEGDPELQGIWVKGEVSNMSRAASGHWYFTLKDKDSQIKCVMWRSAVSRQSITPRDGDALEVFGRITLYAPRGEYQIQAERVRPVGMGDLYLRFEELKATLQAEGLFDPERKRPLPLFPTRIGVVTSPDAAAFQDVQNVLRRRFPLGEIVLSPALVQGADAPPTIVRALERLNRFRQMDVILLCRGGGSIEDLWCFNDERVARAVAASTIPVVTGVGHEVDFTIVDFVSDYRAPSPSAAAEVITQYCAVDDLRARVDEIQDSLDHLLRSRFEELRDNVMLLQRAMGYNSPETYVRTMRQKIDVLYMRMMRQEDTALLLRRERLAARTAALKAADPRALLARGYAIVTQEDGARVKSVQGVAAGTRLRVQLQDGELTTRVEDKDANSDGLVQSKLL
jgi:exodeoxyribonuclease VII large subunit